MRCWCDSADCIARTRACPWACNTKCVGYCWSGGVVRTQLSLGRVARAVAAKDLRIELRSRVVINQVFPFAGLVMVMFAFALDNDDVLTRVAGGLVWLATLFSLIIIIQRSFAVDTADGALEAQRVAGLDPAGIFVGKALAVMAQLVTL
ncbi:MAG: hypothetical protein F2732_01645, partial [Actinobacteria bacterium]|nr:hypothetical protein [Actinomycetota bacterium]